MVEASGIKPSAWKCFERLASVWEQERRGITSGQPLTSGVELGVVPAPRRRSQALLTESEVDVIRTARVNGESVLSISRRFEVGRMAVWEKTR